ncbi:MAG: hypothetical protein GVY05_10680 [Bacteroidetes bacterium]|jgi:hypothetical protein|nr:hypothetical protein [Bacteroidota bacterium]
MQRRGNLFLIGLLCCLLSCKTDKPDEKNNSETLKNVKVTEDQQFLNSIQSAYNTQKFNAEAKVKFNAQVNVSDTVFYDGYLILDTKSKQVRILNSKIDTTISANTIDTKHQKILLWIAETYALPFWLKSENFQKLSSNDSIALSRYQSELTNSEFKISTHPITHIIKNIEYQTDISTAPFDQGRIDLERYITVNRIPVAMEWIITKNKTVSAEVKISRISYPK